jgi:glycosyltransferase involved in cell wall biosynthesis
MFSVVILTLNEEKNLPVCLSSLDRACDDVVVLDSGSKDRTAEIARSAGARVVVNPFENFGAQRNFAHTSIPFRYPWVFHLDADERFTPQLFAECERVAAQNPTEVDGFWVAPKMLFRGRWIPHCTDFPAYQARFAHVQRFRFIQVGHGQREAPEMRLRRLQANYFHDLSADGEDALVAKHRKYARHEGAAYWQHVRQNGASGLSPAELFSSDALTRRRALKRVSQHLPARGPLRFFYQYVVRRGFLDGSPGFSYCWLMARYEHWISQEIKRQRPTPPAS